MAVPKRDLNDKDVVKLLSRLKDTGANYPSDLLSKRRSGFMAGVAALISGGISGPGVSGGGTTGPGHVAGHVHTPLSALSQVDKLVIALEVAALTGLTAYLGVTAYNNRDYLKNLLFPGTPTAIHQVVPTGFSISTEPTATLIPTLTGTPTPTETLEPTSTEGSAIQPGETPQLNPTDPGLHLGQTKNPPSNPPKTPKPPKP